VRQKIQQITPSKMSGTTIERITITSSGVSLSKSS
jgi:hypothetical protein